MFGNDKNVKELEQYMSFAMAGKEPAKMKAKSDKYKEVTAKFDVMMNYKKHMGENAKSIMTTLAGLSTFDVGLRHISDNLGKYANELTDCANSNLAIVEETTASMNQVNDSVVEATNTLEDLARESDELTERNNQSKSIIEEVASLKEHVLLNSKEMNARIEELVTLVKGIENMVQDVQEIADQINLLSLNASIEAARAGEHGRGFAVVADEVSKLASTTMQQLEGMQKFVTDIYAASDAGKDSVERVLDSTNNMSEKIDAVSETVGSNIDKMKEIVCSVEKINDSMQIIKSTTEEVNTAMEQCSQDAEHITAVSQMVHETAMDSVNYSEGIEKIDDALTDITEQIYADVHEGLSLVSNDEFAEIIKKAIEAHSNWINNVEAMVTSMMIKPLQTNPRKCAFGHYYSAFQIHKPELVEIWNRIGEQHGKLHTQGNNVLKEVVAGNQTAAQRYFNECQTASKAVIDDLSEILEKIETMSANGVAVF